MLADTCNPSCINFLLLALVLEQTAHFAAFQAGMLPGLAAKLAARKKYIDQTATISSVGTGTAHRELAQRANPFSSGRRCSGEKPGTEWYAGNFIDKSATGFTVRQQISVALASDSSSFEQGLSNQGATW